MKTKFFSPASACGYLEDGSKVGTSERASEREREKSKSWPSWEKGIFFARGKKKRDFFSGKRKNSWQEGERLRWKLAKVIYADRRQRSSHLLVLFRHEFLFFFPALTPKKLSVSCYRADIFIRKVVDIMARIIYFTPFHMSLLICWHRFLSVPTKWFCKFL